MQLIENSLNIKKSAKDIIYIEKKEELFKLDKKSIEKSITLGSGTNLILESNFAQKVIKFIKTTPKVLTKKDYYLIEFRSGNSLSSCLEFLYQNNIFGLENLCDIPGTIGAAPVQNVGAYGVCIADFVESIDIFDKKNMSFKTLTNKDCLFSYRDSIFKKNCNLIICSISLKIPKNWQANISYKPLKEYFNTKKITPKNIFLKIRNLRQLALENYKTAPNVGSFFKNPFISQKIAKKLTQEFANIPIFKEQNKIKTSAAFLIDKLNFRGFIYKKAQVSKKHALILINYDRTSASSILELAKLIKNQAFKRFEVLLEIEPNILSQNGFIKLDDL